MNKGVEMLMNWGVRATRLGAGRVPPSQRAEVRGMSGAVNLEFGADEGGTWNMVFDGERVRMRRGRLDKPDATVRVASEDYLALIAGDLTISVARMTGKVRVSGDAIFGLLFGASVAGLQMAQSEGGLRGFLARRLVGRALRKGGYTARQEA